MAELGGERRLELQTPTLHVAAMYMDRILQSVNIERDRLQLVAICCILIAVRCPAARAH